MCFLAESGLLWRPLGANFKLLPRWNFSYWSIGYVYRISSRSVQIPWRRQILCVFWRKLGCFGGPQGPILNFFELLPRWNFSYWSIGYVYRISSRSVEIPWRRQLFCVFWRKKKEERRRTRANTQLKSRPDCNSLLDEPTSTSVDKEPNLQANG